MPGFQVCLRRYTIRYRPDSLLVRPGYQEDIAELVTVTRNVVLERVKGDAWAIAQRQSLGQN
jgi:hypothetical protein